LWTKVGLKSLWNREYLLLPPDTSPGPSSSCRVAISTELYHSLPFTVFLFAEIVTGNLYSAECEHEGQLDEQYQNERMWNVRVLSVNLVQLMLSKLDRVSNELRELG
jgi:hypothetical protein